MEGLFIPQQEFGLTKMIGIGSIRYLQLLPPTDLPSFNHNPPLPILNCHSRALFPGFKNPSFFLVPRIYRQIIASSSSTSEYTAIASEQTPMENINSVPNSSMTLLFVEMGVGYDQHGYLSLSAFYSFLLVVVLCIFFFTQ